MTPLSISSSLPRQRLIDTAREVAAKDGPFNEVVTRQADSFVKRLEGFEGDDYAQIRANVNRAEQTASHRVDNMGFVTNVSGIGGMVAMAGSLLAAGFAPRGLTLAVGLGGMAGMLTNHWANTELKEAQQDLSQARLMGRELQQIAEHSQR